MARRWLAALNDDAFQHGLSRFQRALAKVLALAMVLVIVAATLQLLVTLFSQIRPDQMPLLGHELELVLGQVLALLVTIEVLENITAYLKDHAIQVELVLATAITALARKVIVLPADANDKPLLVICLGGSILGLCAAYWLVVRSKRRFRSNSC
jgi:uncharacterized membrane protein (DUF373 family)